MLSWHFPALSTHLRVSAAGGDTGVLNVTLNLTTADLLPVSAVTQAASKVWVRLAACVSVPPHLANVSVPPKQSLVRLCR